MEAAAEALSNTDTGLGHDQAQHVTRLIAQGIPRTREGALEPSADPHASIRLTVRRFAGALIEPTGVLGKDSDKTVRRLLVDAITAGAKVVQTALELTRPAELALRKEAA